MKFAGRAAPAPRAHPLTATGPAFHDRSACCRVDLVELELLSPRGLAPIPCHRILPLIRAAGRVGELSSDSMD